MSQLDSTARRPASADHPEEVHVAHAALRLAEALGQAPPVAMVLGSGLGPVVEAFANPVAVPSVDVGFPQSTVAGHAGRLVRGQLGGVEVVAVSGRVHLYEGLDPAVVVRGVRALHRWGVQRIVFTASVGGITRGLDTGALMLVTDHINLQGRNPLFGPAFGTRFPDLTHAYDPALCAALRAAAGRVGVPLAEGVYAAMPGPTYETPAEVRMLGLLGADVVGMSTAPEVIAANEIGLRAAAIAVVSNPAAGLSASPLTHEEVTESANHAAQSLARLFEAALPALEAG